MLSYNEAKEMFRRCRHKSRGYRLPGRQGTTRLFYSESIDSYVIRYHNTNIVIIKSDGTYRLNNGGYFTMTTKQRIQTYAPVNIVSSLNTWYVLPKDKCIWSMKGKEYNSPCMIEFEDGIIVNSNGEVNLISPRQLMENERLERNRRARERRRLNAPKIAMQKLVASIDKLKE